MDYQEVYPSSSTYTCEAQSTSETYPSDELPSSTSEFYECSSSPEYDTESMEGEESEEVVEEAPNKVRRVLVEPGHVDSMEEEDSEEAVEEATDKVRQVLIETGHMERLKDMMERRLSESGWRIQMMARCREIVKKNGPNTTFEMLFQPLRQLGKDLAPEEAKRDLLQVIKTHYEYEVNKK